MFVKSYIQVKSAEITNILLVINNLYVRLVSTGSTAHCKFPHYITLYTSQYARNGKIQVDFSDSLMLN